MRDEGKKRTVFSRRILLLHGMNALMFTALTIRMVQLQLFESGKYKVMSSKNRLRVSIAPPTRGNITDRNGEIIAGSNPFVRLSIDSRKSIEIMNIISQLNNGILKNPLDITIEKVKSLMRKSPPNSPITIISNLEWEDLAKIEFYRYKLDKVLVETVTRRSYPYIDLYAHMLGYVANPSEKELANSNIPNYQDFVTGKNGLEKIYDESLQGMPGIKENEVNAKGLIIRPISNTDSINGSNITTSLHTGLQQHIAKQFIGKNGACVVLDVNTGQVLAMYSSPTFDPNQFVSGISQSYWDELLYNPNKPLINKCISSSFPPGSTFKPISSLAILESGIDSTHTVLCTGEHKVGSRIYHCVKRSGHGHVDMRMAIAQSCNIYFYKMAQEIGDIRLSETAKQLGLGAATGIELPYEAIGIAPNRRLKLKRRWSIGDTVNMSIGQGYVLTTPLQLAVMAARIASGKLVTPSLLLEEWKLKPLPVKESNLQTVREGMFMGMNDPRGNNYIHRIMNNDFLLAGKTGTAQVASLANSKGNSKLAEHGLFVGFAPYHAPRYAVSCIVEHGVWGSISALPIAKQAMLYLSENSI